MSLFDIFTKESTIKIFRKLTITFIITYLFTLYIHKHYSNVKYWNLPSGYIEERGGSQDLSFSDIYYFQTITWFTIGYGDFTPKDKKLKFMCILNAVIAYIVALS